MTSAPVARPPLEQSTLQAAVGPDWQVSVLARAESTNALAAADPRPRSVVVADHQTAGRGRLGRLWETPDRAALTFSAVIDPQLEPQWWPVLPLMTGIAVARSIGPQARLKWPNDVMIADRKVCGILVERVQALTPVAVIGIGVNVSQRREELPVEHATSLAESGLDTDRTELFASILRRLRSGLAQLLADPHGVVASYRGLSCTIDRDVRVDLPDGSRLEGNAFDIDDHGQLVVHIGPRVRAAQSTPGLPRPSELVTVSAGDVVHVRPVQ